MPPRLLPAPAAPAARALRRAWLPLLCAGVLLLAGALPARAERTLADYALGNYPIGGDFTLTNQDGGRTRLRDFRGKAVLLTFGYTHCADVCPNTMTLFKTVKARLGADAARMQAVFISVDSRRDTPAVLKAWVAQFDPGFVGLTGRHDALQRVSDRYLSKFHVHAESGGGEVEHLAFIYLIDPAGKVRYLFPADVQRDVLVEGVRAVLGRRS